ncbi:MAG: preprotein translocase subunit SecG [Thiothrix sp.]|nr:preprotein translocase subunit SecG [Thiothrix sp.]HPQ97144.1 preprotein translocase subunit SecG [Thiolinea sp.]
MLYNLLLIVQIIVSVGIIVLVLMQHGKGADAGAAFGSGASGTVFGARGSGNFLSRTTAILATVFFINCIALAWLVSNRTPTTSNVMQSLQQTATEQQQAPAQSEVPAVPAGSNSEVPVVAPAAQSEPAAPADNGEVPAASAASVEVPVAPSSESAPVAADTGTTQPARQQ